jgi:CBS domain-containing protein
MRVEEVMSEATGCREGDTVQECARLMRDQDVGFVPICDEQGAPLGAITDRDLAIRVLADGRPASEPVSAFMTRDVVGCRVGDDVQKATELMREEKTTRVMVCDDAGKLKGVISLQDLSRLPDDEVGETVQEVKSDGPQAMH